MEIANMNHEFRCYMNYMKNKKTYLLIGHAE